MPTIIVTGANRGLGLEFARQYAADGWRVIATVRNPARAGELAAVVGDVRVEALDMREPQALAGFAGRLGGEPVDLFIANAGMSGPQRIDSAKAASRAIEVMAVNAIAPALLAEALLLNVASARGVMAAVSSMLGSIADSNGGYVSYRASKAALNAAWRALSLDWESKPVTLLLFHPGWVRTDMGGPQAPLSAGDSVAGMRGVLAANPLLKSGSFVDYLGRPLRW